MILVDRSAWVEFDRATGSATDLRVTDLVVDGGIAVTEPVMMEVLAGARDEESAARLRRLLVSFDWLPLDPVVDFEGAALIYRACRSEGVTPRGMIDCLVANIAIRSEASLLTADADFARIATILPLRLDLV